MRVEFNVSLGNNHVLATAEHSANTPEKAEALAKILKAKFPENEGYIILRTEYQTQGTQQAI